MNHPSEATQSPIEIQLRTLRTTLGDDLVRDLADSVAPNTWRAYRSDLADFATWVAYTNADWRTPEVVATYLRTLEDGGAAYATISRRLTSIHKLVAIAAIAAGDLDYEDPTKHPRVRVTLQAIRRRLSTDQDQANPLTSQRLPAGPVVDRHRHRRGDPRRGPAVGRLVRGAAPLRARRSPTPPPVTGPRRPRTATPPIKSVAGPFGVGADC